VRGAKEFVVGGIPHLESCIKEVKSLWSISNSKSPLKKTWKCSSAVIFLFLLGQQLPLNLLNNFSIY